MQLKEDTKIYYEDSFSLTHELRSLRKYNMLGYKHLIFKDKVRQLEFTEISPDLFVADLPTDRIFEQVYGKYQVYILNGQDNSVKVVSLEPKDFLDAGYRKSLNTYQGTPYRDDKDLFKIKLILAKERKEK